MPPNCRYVVILTLPMCCRYHLNQRFECDFCGQSFSSELYMYKHRLTHLGKEKRRYFEFLHTFIVHIRLLFICTENV